MYPFSHVVPRSLRDKASGHRALVRRVTCRPEQAGARRLASIVNHTSNVTDLSQRCTCRTPMRTADQGFTSSPRPLCYLSVPRARPVSGAPAPALTRRRWEHLRSGHSRTTGPPPAVRMSRHRTARGLPIALPIARSAIAVSGLECTDYKGALPRACAQGRRGSGLPERSTEASQPRRRGVRGVEESAWTRARSSSAATVC